MTRDIDSLTTHRILKMSASDSDVFEEKKPTKKRKKHEPDDPNLEQDDSANARRIAKMEKHASLNRAKTYCAEQLALSMEDPEFAEQWRQAEAKRAAWRAAAAKAQGTKKWAPRTLTRKEMRRQMKTDLEAGHWQKWSHRHVPRCWTHRVGPSNILS